MIIHVKNLPSIINTVIFAEKNCVKFQMKMLVISFYCRTAVLCINKWFSVSLALSLNNRASEITSMIKFAAVNTDSRCLQIDNHLSW